MKRVLTIAAAAALVIGVSLPAAAINPFGASSGFVAMATEATVAVDADGSQQVADDLAASASTATRDSFASEPKPVVVLKSFAATYSGPILDAWRGMMSNWPVPGARIGVRFTGGHDGIDFLAAQGTPILATADGTVVKVGTMGTLGDMVQIDHGSGIQSLYGHMIHGSQTVSPGQFVHAGEVIGYVGQTGSATTPHCHYGVIANGRIVDPAPFLGL